METGPLSNEVITFKLIEPLQWSVVKDRVMYLETFFHPNLAQTEEELKHTFTLSSNISYGLFDGNGELQGYITGAPLEEYLHFPGVPEDINCGKHNTIYIESVIVDKSFRDKGYGRELRRLFTKEARRRGYKYITAHEKQGLPRREVIMDFPDWSGSGRVYSYYRLKIEDTDI